MRTKNRRLAATVLPALICAIGFAAAPAANASPSQLSWFDASNEESGEFGPKVRDDSLDELAALGVDVVRFQVYWRYVAPSPDAAAPPAGFNARDPNTYGPGGANWAPIDAVVKGAAARGMDVSLVVSGQPPTGRVPKWASQDPDRTMSAPSPAAFQDFMHALGKRYNGASGSSGLARYVSLWNEPNSATFLRARGRKAVAVPNLYRRLVIAGTAGLRDAAWPGKVLIGELGPAPPNKFHRPIKFMTRVLCLTKKGKRGRGCSALQIDGIAHHPYSFGRAPYQAALNSGQISIGNFKLLAKLIRRATRARAITRGARLYNTEYGYPSRPDSATGTPRRLQAAYISIAEYLTYKMPIVASFGQYLMRDDAPGSPAFGFTSGLCPHNAGNTVASKGAGCKPAFGAFRTSLVVRAKRGRNGAGPVRIWGHIRPANGPTLAQIRVRSRRGQPRTLKVVRTNASGYFQFRSAGGRGKRWSVSWNGVSGPFIRAFSF